MANVRELMTPNPVKVQQQTSVADCARMMWRLHIRHVPVVDADGAYSSVVSDFDVLQHGDLANAHDPVWVDRVGGRATAGSVGRSMAVLARPDDDLVQVLRAMVELQREVIVVTDVARHPVGIITEHDAVRWARTFLPDNALVPLEAGSLIGVDWDEPGFSAFEAMVDNGVRHVLVTHRDKVVGVLSWRDLVVDDLVSWNPAPVRSLVARSKLITLPPDSTLRQVADCMVRERIGLVPLMDDEGKVHGVVARSDIVRRLAQPDRA